MNRLTCNQLMLLLALHRGSQVSDVAVGTLTVDFDVLFSLGYTDAMHCLTTAGRVRVVRALTGLAV
jgi:hypothetical protein